MQHPSGMSNKRWNIQGWDLLSLKTYKANSAMCVVFN